MITGPGGSSVLANVITTTEQSVDFVTELIANAREHGCTVIETDPGSEAKWMDYVTEVAEGTLTATPARRTPGTPAPTCPERRLRS
jgi:cyclohexanone monooxygenase